MKPRLLDRFCGEGGAARGYRRAGFYVVGVDRKHQPRYCGDEFIEGDALDLDPSFVASFDAHHASPPCQIFSELTPDDARGGHLNLIPSTRLQLQGTCKPYVIENVRKARTHLIDPISLFGTMFDCHVVTSAGQRFDLSRERLFETNWPFTAPPPKKPAFPVANVYGGHFRVRSGHYRTGNGTGRTVDMPGEDRAGLARRLMDMPWATMNGMSEAIPPAYTEWLGAQLLHHLRGAA